MIAVMNNQDFTSVLRQCFATDPELISTYHIEAGSSLDDCVKRTAADLKKDASGAELYEIRDGETLVGFFGKEFGNYLTTIFIKPDYRKSESVRAIWNLIQSHFDSDFYTAIYSKNTRAASFFQKNGELIETFNVGGNRAVAFKFSKGAK